MGQPLTEQATNSSNENGAPNYSEKQIESGEVEDRNETRNMAAPVAAKGGFGSKAKRHCAKYWWLHLIIFCVSFLIIALCLTYVGLPRIAQKAVSESSLEATVLKFLNPTPNSITLTQGATLHSPSIFTPTFDPFSAASWLVSNGTFGAAPMLYIQMPTIHALHPSSTTLISNQVVQISDMDQLTAFAIAVLTQETVTSALTGKTKMHEGALPVNTVDFNSTITFKGLNGLKGFNVTGAKLNLSAAAGTPNFKGTAYIPNPSLMTIEMGNVTLALSTAKFGVVGNSTIENLTLVPGDNFLPMSAIINQTMVLGSMNTTTGIVETFIQGNSAVYNGQHLIYYEKALTSNHLVLEMNVTQILLDSLA